MDSIERCHITTNMDLGEQLDAEITTYQERYRRLVQVLGRVGTEVYVMRSIESDPHIRPGHFVRNAKHDFIFPKQEDATLVRDYSKVMSAGTAYEIKVDSVLRHTTDKGTSQVHVWYDDSSNRVDFRLRGESTEGTDIPEDVMTAINEAIGSDEVMEKKDQNPGIRRSQIIIAMLDEVMPIKDGMPDDIVEGVDLERQVLAMNAGWTKADIGELEAMWLQNHDSLPYKTKLHFLFES